MMIPVKVILATLALLLALGAQLPGTEGLPPPWVQTYRFPGKNLDGDLLVLDYSSLSPLTIVDSEEKCEKACKSILDCNAYVYCAGATGCGKSCSSYVSSNPKLPLPSGSSNYKTQSLPIAAFGGFQSGNGCQGNKWKKGLCSLKKIPDTNIPRFSTIEKDAGWRSGVINITSAWSCTGIPFGLCEQCSSYWVYGAPGGQSFSQCQACSTAVTKSLPGGVATTLEQATKQWACGWCFTDKPTDVVLDRSKCFNCVAKHAVNGLHNLCIY